MGAVSVVVDVDRRMGVGRIGEMAVGCPHRLCCFGCSVGAGDLARSGDAGLCARGHAAVCRCAGVLAGSGAAVACWQLACTESHSDCVDGHDSLAAAVAGAGAASSGTRVVADVDDYHLDFRYCGVFLRKALGETQARTHNQPWQDLGRCRGCAGRSDAVLCRYQHRFFDGARRTNGSSRARSVLGIGRTRRGG